MKLYRSKLMRDTEAVVASVDCPKCDSWPHSKCVRYDRDAHRMVFVDYVHSERRVAYADSYRTNTTPRRERARKGKCK